MLPAQIGESPKGHAGKKSGGEQLTFFASLDFPADRVILTVAEIAEKIRYTVQHVLNLIETGELTALNGAGKYATRGSMRVPIESYRDFIVRRMTGPMRAEFIANLPESTRTALILESFASLPSAARNSLLRQLRTSLAA